MLQVRNVCQRLAARLRTAGFASAMEFSVSSTMCLAITRLLNTCSNGTHCGRRSSQTTSYPVSALTALTVCPVVLVGQMMTSQPRLTNRSKLDWVLAPLSTPILTPLMLSTTLSSTLVLCSCSTLATGYFAHSNSSTVLIVWLLPTFFCPLMRILFSRFSVLM
jgi:hypothetical protein